jgi:hypothetical protein
LKQSRVFSREQRDLEVAPKVGRGAGETRLFNLFMALPNVSGGHTDFA